MGKFIDETGNRHGRLTVLKRTESSKWGATQWLCRCDCGETTIAIGGHLRNGHTKSCGCWRKERLSTASVIDLTGHRYGRLTVIRKVGKQRKGITWLCKCDCGKEVVVVCNNLRNGQTKSCGCLRREIHLLPKGEAAFNVLVRRTKGSAKRRGYEWSLTKEQIRHLTKQPCHYCGVEPSQVIKHPRLNGKYVYNGLDRIDSNKGYVKGNVVACCGTCNMAKGTKTLEEFNVWIDDLCQHRQKELGHAD